MLRLHDEATRSSYKVMYIVPKGTHNDAWMDNIENNQYWPTMKKFVDHCIKLFKTSKIENKKLIN